MNILQQLHYKYPADGGLKVGYRKTTVCAAVLIAFVICLSGCFGKADKLYKDGKAMYEEGRYDESIACFQKAIEESPDKAEYHIAYATALSAIGKYDEAREKFIEVIRDTDNKIVRENNKKAYLGIAMSYFQGGVYDQAKAYFEIALKNKELHSLDNDAKAYIAECEMYMADYEEALKYWNEIIEDDSKNTRYFLGRAKVNTALLYTDEAKKDYQSAIDTDRHCYAAYIGLYLMLSESGSSEEASKILDTALELSEKDEDNIFYTSVFRYYKKDTDAALEGFNTALENGNNEALYYIGRINQDNGDIEEAVSDYEKYSETCPGSTGADFCNQYAGCLCELGRYEEAKDWIEKGVAGAAGSVRKKLMFNEIVIYEKLGDYKEAARCANEYLETYKDENMEQEYEYIKTRYREEDNAE